MGSPHMRTIWSCMKDCQEYLREKDSFCTLQEVYDFFADLSMRKRLEPRLQSLLLTYLHVSAVSGCIVRGDVMCLAECFDTAMEKLERIVISHQAVKIEEAELLFLRQASRAEQIAIGNTRYFLHESSNSLSLGQWNHPCSCDYLPVHLYFIIEALDAIIALLNSSDQPQPYSRIAEVIRSDCSGQAQRSFVGLVNKIKKNRLKPILGSYPDLFLVMDCSVRLSVNNHQQASEVVETNFNEAMTRVESLLSEAPAWCDDLYVKCRDGVPRSNQHALGSSCDEFVESLCSQQSIFNVSDSGAVELKRRGLSEFPAVTVASALSSPSDERIHNQGPTGGLSSTSEVGRWRKDGCDGFPFVHSAASTHSDGVDDMVGDYENVLSFIQSLASGVEHGASCANMESSLVHPPRSCNPVEESVTKVNELDFAMPDTCSVTIIKEDNWFQQYLKEKLSVFPIMALDYANGWLLIHLWEGGSYAVDIGALSLPPTRHTGVGMKVAGGTPDNVNKWAIIHGAVELLSETSILVVVHGAATLVANLEKETGLKIVGRMFDVMIAEGIICNNPAPKSLRELLDFHQIAPFRQVEVVMGVMGSHVADNPTDFRGEPLQDAINDLKEMTQLSARMVPFLYQKILRKMTTPMLEELNKCCENILKKNQQSGFWDNSEGVCWSATSMLGAQPDTTMAATGHLQDWTSERTRELLQGQQRPPSQPSLSGAKPKKKKKKKTEKSCESPQTLVTKAKEPTDKERGEDGSPRQQHVQSPQGQKEHSKFECGKGLPLSQSLSSNASSTLMVRDIQGSEITRESQDSQHEPPPQPSPFVAKPKKKKEKKASKKQPGAENPVSKANAPTAERDSANSFLQPMVSHSNMSGTSESNKSPVDGNMRAQQQPTQLTNLKGKAKPLPEREESSCPLLMQPMVLQYKTDKKPVFFHLLSELAIVPINPSEVSVALDEEFEQLASCDAGKFVEAFGKSIHSCVAQIAEKDPQCALEGLAEIIMDVGRKPFARYFNRGSTTNMVTRILGDEVVTKEDLKTILKGSSVVMAAARRACITGTLHQIGVIVNRQEEPIGITGRVQRPILGCLNPVYDIFHQDRSVLLVGPPGVGKTTLLREAARVLSDIDCRSVFIVDTFGKIAGEGDVPHLSVGSARRVEVPCIDVQQEVMMEVVRNHHPETVIIDEIHSWAEAKAALCIRQRGIQVIASVTAQTLLEVLHNPGLGEPPAKGDRGVAWGSDEAGCTGSQGGLSWQTLAALAFAVLVEMRDRHRWLIHRNLSCAVGAVMDGEEPIRVEERRVASVKADDGDDHGERVIVMETYIHYQAASCQSPIP